MLNSLHSLARAAVCLLWIGTNVPEVRASTIFLNNLAHAAAGDQAGDLVGQAIQIGNVDVLIQTIQIKAFNNTATGVTFDIYSRNANGTVGSALGAPAALSFNPVNSILTATLSQMFDLHANTGYWIVFGDSQNLYGWEYTSSKQYTGNGISMPTLDTSFYRYNNVDTYYNLADGPELLEIQGTFAPEPGAVTLLSAGALAFLGLRRRMIRR